MVLSQYLQKEYEELDWRSRTLVDVTRHWLIGLQILPCLYMSGAFIGTLTVVIKVVIGTAPLDHSIIAEANLTAYKMDYSRMWKKMTK